MKSSELFVAGEENLDETQLEAANEAAEFARRALVRVRENAGRHSIALIEPERWLKIAIHLLSGKAKTHLRNDHGGIADFYTIERVLAELQMTEGYEQVKERFALASLRNINVLDDLQMLCAEKILKAVESGEYVPEPQDLKHITFAKRTESDILTRSKGEATHITEERKITIDDALSAREAAMKRIEEMKRAESVDKEVVDV